MILRLQAFVHEFQKVHEARIQIPDGDFALMGVDELVDAYVKEALAMLRRDMATPDQSCIRKWPDSP